MADITGVIAIIGTFGMAPLIVYLRGRHRERERELEIEAKRQLALPAGGDVSKLEDENKLLRERVENLESIVCSVDFELNQKLAKLVDEQRSAVVDPPSPTPALDKTATAVGQKPPAPLTTTLEAGQVLAQRYRVQRLLGKGGM